MENMTINRYDIYDYYHHSSYDLQQTFKNKNFSPYKSGLCFIDKEYFLNINNKIPMNFLNKCRHSRNKISL